MDIKPLLTTFGSNALDRVKEACCSPLSSFFKLSGIYAIYNLYDSAIANMLGLETFRHGTSLYKWCCIKLKGADPNKGKNSSKWIIGGNSPGALERCAGHFFTFYDSEFSTPGYCPKSSITSKIFKRILPKQHTFCASVGDAEKLGESLTKNKTVIKVIKIFAGTIFTVISLAVTPTLKVRMTLEKSKSEFQFERDIDYGGFAQKTKKAISPKYFGIIGSITQGVNRGVFGRIRRNPAKFLTGLVQLVAAVALTAFALQFTIAVSIQAAVLSLLGTNALVLKTASIVGWIGLQLIYFSAW